MKLHRALLVPTAGAAALALAATAGGTTSRAAQLRHFKQPVEALAMDGRRIAYDLGARYVTGAASNKVLVWNVRIGKTVKVSGKRTAAADTSSTGSGVFQLAIAGTRVSWLVNVGGNLEGDDYLFASSVVKPKERQVASDIRYGDNCPGRSQALCAGKWLGGLVGSGNLIAVNRWTTDSNGAVTQAELDVLGSAQLKQVATGTETVEAVSAAAGRVAVLSLNGSVGLYSASGNLLRTVTPSSAVGAALGGRNLVVLTRQRMLQVYDARTGALRKTLGVHAGATPENLDVQGNVAIYTQGALHAVNLSSGKDRVIAKLPRGVELARIAPAGVAYAGGRTLGFLPFKRVTAAVAG